MRSLLDNLAVRWLANAQTLTGTTKSKLLDRAGYETAAILWSVGVDAALDGSNYWTPTVQESDTTVDGDFTTVAAADLLYTPTVVDSTSEDDVTQVMEYRGTKRYIRLLLTETGTLSGPHAIIGLLGRGVHSPLGSVAVGTTAT